MASDGRADVGEKLLVVPRLLDEVLGARADGIDDVADGAEGGDHDDRKIGLRLDDARQEIDAAFARQCEVEQEQVVLVLRDELHAGGAIGGHADGEAFEREQRIERLADGGLIVDDEDARTAGDVVGGLRLRFGNYLGCLRHGSSSSQTPAHRLRLAGRAPEAGNSSWKAVPTPSSLSTWILPACSCMMP